jgi:hypothetical protein
VGYTCSARADEVRQAVFVCVRALSLSCFSADIAFSLCLSLSAARARALSLLRALSHSLPPFVITLSFTCILYRGNAPPAQFLSLPLSLPPPPLSLARAFSQRAGDTRSVSTPRALQFGSTLPGVTTHYQKL